MADSQKFRKSFYLGNVILLVVVVFILGAIFMLRDFFGSTKLDWTADKIYTVSPKTKEILGKLKDDVTIKYYVSEELPAQLKTLKRDTKDLFDEFRELSNERVHYEIIDPNEEARKEAEKLVQKYEDDKKAGKTPEEPEPVQDIADLFSGRPKAKPEDIRANREKLAANLAAQQKRSKEEVFRDLLVEDYKKNYLRKLEQEGIGSFPYNEREASSVKQGRLYSAIEISYLSRQAEVIPVHFQLETLEYEIASRVLKLAVDEKPVVAFFDGRKPAAPPPNPRNPTPPPESEYDGIINALGQHFDIRTLDLKENDAIDDLVKRIKDDQFRKTLEGKSEEEKKDLEAKQDKEVKPEDLRTYLKCLVVAQPDQLEPRQVYEISRAISLGVSTILLVGRYSLDSSQQGVRQGLPINILTPGVEDLLRKWGIELGSELLASNEMGTIDLPQQVFANMPPMMYPREVAVCVASTQDSLDQSSPLTSRIPAIIFPATTGLKVLADVTQKAGLTTQILAKTVPESWSVKIDPFQKRNPFNPQAGFGATLGQYKEDLVPPKNPEEFRDFIDPVPLAVLVQGKLPFQFEGETIPDWKKVEAPKDGKDPHAGIPGLQGLPGLGDEDLAFNAQDEGAAKAPAGAPPAPAAPAVPPPAATSAAPAPAPSAAPQTPAPATPGATPPTAAGATAPAEPPRPAEKPRASVTPVSGSVLILSSVDMMKTQYLASQSRAYQPNVNFFYNAVENYGLGNQLIEIRQKQLTERRFKPGSDKVAGYIKWFNAAVVPACVAIFGLAYFLLRRRDSVAYERKYIQRHQG